MSSDSPRGDGQCDGRSKTYALEGAAALLVTPEHRYLMQLRSNIPELHLANHWGLFGGHIEPQETPIEALRRELIEELEFSPRHISWFTEISYRIPITNFGPIHKTFFEVPVASAEVAEMRLHEGDGMRLFSFEELAHQPNTVPWDFFGVLLHVRRWEIRGRPSVARKDTGKILASRHAAFAQPVICEPGGAAGRPVEHAIGIDH